MIACGDGRNRWYGSSSLSHLRRFFAFGLTSTYTKADPKRSPVRTMALFSLSPHSTVTVKPQCLGHTWLSIDNQSGHSVYIKDHEIKHDEMITFSVWAVSDLPGLLFNLEEAYISTYDRYVGRKSLSVNIGEPQLKIIEAYIDQKDKWSPGKNCSYWSARLWNEVVDEAFGLKTQTLFYTPKRLERSFCEFDCVEADKDFSRAGHIFCYRDGVRTELELCS